MFHNNLADMRIFLNYIYILMLFKNTSGFTKHICIVNMFI